MVVLALLWAAPSSKAESDLHYRSVQTPHGTLRVAVREAGRGRPILLLHGLATSSYTWRYLIPVLAKDHHVIALDLRGFGASDKPNDAFYSIEDQMQLVKAFIEQENLRNLTIIGHSYGGGVTLSLTLKGLQDKTPRIKNIILIDTIAYRQRLPIFFHILTTPILGELGMGIVPPEMQAEQALRIAYSDKEKITSEAIAEYAKPLHSEDAKHALMEAVDKIVPDDVDTLPQRYRTLQIPAQIIWGQDDKVVPVYFGTKLKEDIVNSEFVVLSACGHLPQEEKPSETAKAILSFLSRHGG